MFTGIVETVGTVAELSTDRGGGLLRVAAPAAFVERLREGDSIAVSGCCLTITALDQDRFAADLSSETLRRTRLGRLRPRERLNLERPLRAGTPLGGHWVQGHIDAIGAVRENRPGWLRVRLPYEVLPYVVWKGSIAVDGVSLTVAGLEGEIASFAIVPFTRTHTNFASLRRGHAVNLEADVLARYVERLLSPLGAARRGKAKAVAGGVARWSVEDWHARGF